MQDLLRVPIAGRQSVYGSSCADFVGKDQGKVHWSSLLGVNALLSQLNEEFIQMDVFPLLFLFAPYLEACMLATEWKLHILPPLLHYPPPFFLFFNNALLPPPPPPSDLFFQNCKIIKQWHGKGVTG